MFLYVTAKGSRLWRLKYRFKGKEKLLALGSYPAVNLKQARERRDAARALLQDGKDPAAERKREKRDAHLQLANAFEVVAREFVNQQKVRWSHPYAVGFLRRIEVDVFPDLGTRPIADIMALELLDAIRRLEKRGATFLAHRVLQLCKQVFRFGVVTGRCDKNVAADLHIALIPHVAKPQRAIPPKDLPDLLLAIKGYDGEPVTRLGLQMLALPSFARSS